MCMILEVSRLKLVSAAPIAMQYSREEKPQISEIPTPRKIKAMISARRFPSFLKKRSGTVKSIPVMKPTTKAPPISITGERRASPKVISPPARALAMATQIPKYIRAVASSIATTESKVSVIGPLALYCLITMMVAAGAVAAAIAPSTKENESSKPAATRPMTTAITANSDSKIAITMGVAPTRLK